MVDTEAAFNPTVTWSLLVLSTIVSTFLYNADVIEHEVQPNSISNLDVMGTGTVAPPPEKAEQTP